MKKKNENNEKYFITAVLAAALLFALYYFHVGSPAIASPLDKTFNVTTITLTHDGQTEYYYAYVAQNLAQQELGYMNQTSLGDCDGHSPCIGMLFQFQNSSEYCFWMANTKIPLKQAWISQNGTVVYEYEGTPYSTLSICYTGTAVLETSPNQTLATGDIVTPGSGSSGSVT